MNPTFWRDDKLPFIELRSIADGREACYAKHAHESFSIGAIRSGTSTYINGATRQVIGAGTVVVMNPGDVHACNPIGEQPWSYSMFHVDVTWLARLQHDLGCSRDGGFRPFATISTRVLFNQLNDLYATLTDGHAGQLEKEGAAIGFFSHMQRMLMPAPLVAEDAGARLARAAEFINDNFTRLVSVDDISAAAGLSPAHLIRSFKSRFGMTPHAYLVNRRIEHGRAQLRRGLPIAEVALDAGFADQAHFQRAFKQHVAATPGQYRRHLVP